MLGKLMKYEVKASARIFLPLYGTVLALGLINKLFTVMNAAFGYNMAFPIELTMMLAMLTYVFVICAVFVMTLIVTVQRFYKNLLGDEGYLMFTLPVKPWQHILSKMVVAGLWFIVSTFVTVLSLLILGFNMEVLQAIPQETWRILLQLFDEFGVHTPLYAIEGIVSGFALLASGILLIYASMSVGHLANKWRMLLSFGAFVGISFLSQLLNGIGFFIFAEVISRTAPFEYLFTHPFASMHFGMALFILWSLFYCAVYFVITNAVLTRRLNLE